MLTSTREVPARRRLVAEDSRTATAATTIALWSALLLVPSILTVLRYSADYLNADGVQQSVMSVQGPELFYWGQDRLFPAVSWIASPIADPTVNLWTCLVLQALSLHGLLLYLAVRGSGVLREATASPPRRRRTVVLAYLVLVSAVNALWSPAMMQSLATEGQPYALSWLLTALAFESWRRETWAGRVTAAALAFVALGINPSAVLVAAFLAVTQTLRTRRILSWAAFLGVLAVLFMAWTFLSSTFAMYPTSARTEAPSYMSFSFDVFAAGFPAAIANVVGVHRPLRTLVVLLLALAATIVLSDALRSRLVLLGSYFAGFTLLYVALFAGNEWVMMNDFHFRYFFPLQLLIVLAVAMPITGAVVEVSERLRTSEGAFSRLPTSLPLALALVATAIVFVGPVRSPQDAPALTKDDATESYARTNDIAFISGNYWNMWPLMHGLLDGGRDAVYVAGYKSNGDPADYLATLERQLARDGEARALCVNEEVATCANYLDYWTRAGWKPARGSDAYCPTTPSYDSRRPEPTCRVLTFRSPVQTGSRS